MVGGHQQQQQQQQQRSLTLSKFGLLVGCIPTRHHQSMNFKYEMNLLAAAVVMVAQGQFPSVIRRFSLRSVGAYVLTAVVHQNGRANGGTDFFLLSREKKRPTSKF